MRATTFSRRPYWMLFCIGFAILSGLSVAPQTAQAGEFQLSLGIGGAGTEWRGDGSLHSQLKIGYRLWDWLGFYGDFHLGYAHVDQRVMTLFSLGVQAWAKWGIVRPYARFSLLHQHEESLSVIAGDFLSAIVGIGEGIRHRGGLSLALGADIPLFKKKKLEFFLTIEGIVKWFPGDMGPAIYAGGILGFGLNYKM